MMINREIAEKIHEDLNKRGAGLGNASIEIISETLDDMQMKSLPLLKVEHIPSFGTMPEHWIAWLEGTKGMVVTADTEEQAIDELMISIKVMLLYKRGNG